MSSLNARSPIQLEVCIASVQDAIAASSGGADRLELNIGLELGGLTPSVGLFEEVKDAVEIPVVTMIRPRAAGFCYTRAERRVMLRDTEQLLNAGASGIVAGVLQESGDLDEAFWRVLRRLVGPRELVFHRAIDVAARPQSLLQRLIDSGTHRVLTSGGSRTAWEGREQIGRYRELAAERIEILAGAGIEPGNALSLIRATGCRQLHGSFREWANDPAGDVADSNYPVTSTRLVAATRAVLDRDVSEGSAVHQPTE